MVRTYSQVPIDGHDAYGKNKNAGTTDYDPEIGWSDVLHKEVIGEQKQALLVCKSVLSTEVDLEIY